MKHKISIVGAGFSGLTLAWFLEKQGHEISIYEKEHRVGGLLQTERHPEMLVEKAANGLLNSDLVEELFKDLGVEMLSAKDTSKSRFIWRDRPRRWPLDLVESLKFLFFFLPRVIFNRSSLRPQPSQSIEEWSKKYLGGAVTKYLLEPALQGIYAGDIRKLSASLILGRFFKMKSRPPGKKRFRETVAPKNGMQSLTDALRTKLSERGVRFITQEGIFLDQVTHPLVIATSAFEAARVLKNLDPKLSEKLTRIEPLPLLSVGVAFQNPQVKIKGFGMLVPRDLGIQTLGILSNSCIFENRGELYNETWILGGALDPQVAEMSDHQVKKLILKEREILLGDRTSFEFCQITRWPKALPHYTVAHEKLLAELSPLPGIFLAGNYLGALGLGQILERNQRLAEEISRG